MCEYCNNNPLMNFDDNDSNLILIINPRNKRLAIEVRINKITLSSSKSINFCPICGRNLKEEGSNE